MSCVRSGSERSAPHSERTPSAAPCSSSDSSCGAHDGPRASTTASLIGATSGAGDSVSDRRRSEGSVTAASARRAEVSCGQPRSSSEVSATHGRSSTASAASSNPSTVQSVSDSSAPSAPSAASGAPPGARRLQTSVRRRRQRRWASGRASGSSSAVQLGSVSASVWAGRPRSVGPSAAHTSSARNDVARSRASTSGGARAHQCCEARAHAGLCRLAARKVEQTRSKATAAARPSSWSSDAQTEAQRSTDRRVVASAEGLILLRGGVAPRVGRRAARPAAPSSRELTPPAAAAVDSQRASAARPPPHPWSASPPAPARRSR